MKYNILTQKKTLALAICGAFLAPTTQAALEEVVVTAQKREQTLQDVPISLSVVDGNMVKDMGVRDFADLSSYVPNFFVQDSPSNYAIFIRGMGSTAGNLAFEQTVGLFIDGVYAGRGRQFQSPFLDLERVEVLRGPQGALVGKNTSAGAVNVLTKKPTETAEGRVLAGYEFETETFNTEAILSGALGESLYGRLALKYTDTAKGYTQNVTLGGDEKQVEDSVIRGTLVWDANENLEVISKIEFGRSRIDGNTYETEFGGQNFDYRRETSGFPDLGGVDTNDTDTANFTLTANYTFDDFTLTSITAYSEYDFHKFVDADFTEATLFGSIFAEDFNQISQEIRLISPSFDRYEYAVGLYLHQTEYDLEQASSIQLGPFNGTAARNFQQENDVASLYGQFMYRITDDVRISVSGRQTRDKKEANQERSIIGTVLPSWLDTPLSGERTENEFDPAINLQWDITPALMAYVSWSEGSKAGGFVGAQATTKMEDFQFEAEEAETFELGVKAEFFDNSLMVNAAYFKTDYENLQVSTFDATTSGFVTGNAASATTEGFEIDGAWAINENLMLRASGSYLDPEYNEFIGAQCLWSNPGCDVSTNNIGGEQLPYTSKVSGSLNIVYEVPLTARLNFLADLGIRYSGERQLTEIQHPLTMQDSFTKSDLRIAIMDADDRWTLALVGKNITDEETFSYSFGTPLAPAGTFTYLMDAPRTVAIQAEYRFF